MRIAVFHNQPSGGARRALHGFCSHLRAEHTIDVYTFTTADDTWLHDADVADRVVRSELRRRRPITAGLYLNDVARARDLSQLVAAYKDVAGRVDDAGYDVVLVDICQYTLVPSVLTDLRTPSVFYAHNGPAWLEDRSWDPPTDLRARTRDVWHRPFADALARRVVRIQADAARAASRVVTNSDHTARRLRAAYGVDAVVCPPGIDIPPVVPTPESAYVLSVGEVEPRKGYAFLVDALACIEEPLRPPLRIIANRANPIELAQLVRRARGAGVNMEILVDPPASLLWSSYDESRLFVYAAHHEALGLAPLEAMARATPVVAIGEGGVAATVVPGRTGELTPRDPGAFGHAVRALLIDDGRRRRYGAEARRVAESNWSWPARAAALESLLVATAEQHQASLQ